MRTAMVRSFVVAVAALAAWTTAGLAAEKKPHPVSGVVKTVDAAAGALTVTVKSKKETKDVNFTIDDSVKVVIYTGADKKELTGKDGLKNDAVKQGVKVSVVSDAAGKVTELDVGSKPHHHHAKGTIKKVDAAGGVLTVT